MRIQITCDEKSSPVGRRLQTLLVLHGFTTAVLAGTAIIEDETPVTEIVELGRWVKGQRSYLSVFSQHQSMELKTEVREAINSMARSLWTLQDLVAIKASEAQEGQG